jgi:signal transduction histidine kinase
MRIQTRLFLGTALLVLALMATQWWLHLGQLRAMEAELGAVAASVGKDILRAGPQVLMRELDGETSGMSWVEGPNPPDATGEVHLKRDVHVVLLPEEAGANESWSVTRRVAPGPPPAADEAGTDDVEGRLEAEVMADRLEVQGVASMHAIVGSACDGEERQFVLKVVAGDQGAERFLEISNDGGRLQRIPIPLEPAVRSFRSTMRRGFIVGGVLLVVGLVGAGVLANRVARPLRGLTEGAEAVGRGELGVQVPVTAAGEVGDLQRSFNVMSARLAELETERDRWREREHLAQLGDLSRGLAHTLRNPLNTLGLAVDELASGEGDPDELAVTARSQIRRIDQWLRSFLALGAEDAAEPAMEDLGDLVRAVVFEAVQQGAPVRVETAGGEVPVLVVGTAVRAAVANLVENATHATTAGGTVEVEVRREGDLAVVTIRDHGPGLPDDVRRRLFEPHVTTKAGGSGMGLFLARQLVVGMHGGTLAIDDHADGGTMAVMKIPLGAGGENAGSDGDAR